MVSKERYGVLVITILEPCWAKLMTGIKSPRSIERRYTFFMMKDFVLIIRFYSVSGMIVKVKVEL